MNQQNHFVRYTVEKAVDSKHIFLSHFHLLLVLVEMSKENNKSRILCVQEWSGREKWYTDANLSMVFSPFTYSLQSNKQQIDTYCYPVIFWIYTRNIETRVSNLQSKKLKLFQSWKWNIATVESMANKYTTVLCYGTVNREPVEGSWSQSSPYLFINRLNNKTI